MPRSQEEATIASALGRHVWETKAYWTVQEGLVVSGTTELGQQGHRANLCFVCSPEFNTVTIEYVVLQISGLWLSAFSSLILVFLFQIRLPWRSTRPRPREAEHGLETNGAPFAIA